MFRFKEKCEMNDLNENAGRAYGDFAEVYDEFMDETPYEAWCDRIDKLIEKYGVSKKNRAAEDVLESESNLVVDLGCGTGTLTELLYNRGYDMIGVDYSEAMLGIAMRKKLQTGSEILYLNQELSRLNGCFASPGGMP